MTDAPQSPYPVSEEREALRRLYNEVSGCWSAFKYELREAISSTNYAVVQHKLDAAKAILDCPAQPLDPDQTGKVTDEATPTKEDFAKWSRVWHDTCETMVTLLGLPGSGSPQELLAQVQYYVSNAQSEKDQSWKLEADALSVDVARLETEAEHQSEMTAWQCLGLQNEIDRLRAALNVAQEAVPCGALIRAEIAKVICCGDKCILDSVSGCVAMKYGDDKKADLIIALLALPSTHQSAPAVNSSLPSGESDPSVTLDCAGADTRLAERLADVVMMLDAPDAYNREYIAAVCRSILSSVTSTPRGDAT
jgi:hypothetical protein